MPLSELHSARILDDPSLASLPRVSASVEASSDAEDVEALLQQFPNHPGVLVHEGNEPPRVLSRNVLSERMSRPYSRSLYLKRPLSNLLEGIEIETLCLGVRVPISEAVAQALGRDQSSAYDRSS
jgi:hypothetical protein